MELLERARQWASHDPDPVTASALSSDIEAAERGDEEAAALTDDEIVAACRASMAAGADFVKTSTGFHPAGGASTHAVALMRATVGDALGVKASGGIRDAETALAMIEAGASRLGVSATNAILAGLED